MRSLNKLKNRRRLYWRPRWLQRGGGGFRHKPRSARADISSCTTVCKRRIFFAYAPQDKEIERGVTYTHICAKCVQAFSQDRMPEELPCPRAVAEVVRGRRSLELHQASTEALTTWLEGELELYGEMEYCNQDSKYFSSIQSAVDSRHRDRYARLEALLARARDRHDDGFFADAVSSTDRFFRSINRDLFPEIAEMLGTLVQGYTRVPRLGLDCSEADESRVRSEVESNAESRTTHEPVIASREMSHPPSGLESQSSAHIEDGDDDDNSHRNSTIVSH